jgi:hypothetical protein
MNEEQPELQRLKALGLRRLGGVGSLLDWLFRPDIDALGCRRPVDLIGTREGRAKVRAALLKIKIPGRPAKIKEG